MSKTHVILISGKKQHGKTSLAKLYELLGYKRASLADGLKLIDDNAYRLKQSKQKIAFNDPWKDSGRYEERIEEILRKMGFTKTKEMLTEIIDLYGNDNFTKLENGKRRYALQFIGTDYLRKKDPYCHIRYLYNNNKDIFENGEKLVIDDARFINEIDMDKWLEVDADWTKIHVFRTAYEDVKDDHPSENVPDPVSYNYDLTIRASDLQELYKQGLNTIL